jgi:TfoX/Sxy family transcriptional regulator of competence genes
MATRPETIAFLLDQLSALPNIRTHRMFGEYALYCDEKVVAFICDDELFIKPTQPGRAFVEAAGALDEAPAYPGSKLYLRIGGDRCEESDWLVELVRITAAAVPVPKPKKPRSRG